MTRIVKSLVTTGPEAVQVFHALYALQAPDPAAKSALIDNLVETLAFSGALSELRDQSQETFRARLAAAQAIGPLATLGKALALLISNERNFISAQTITDLRPGIGDNIALGPSAYVILHQLQLEYQREKVAASTATSSRLDEYEVRALISALQRSLEKPEARKASLQPMTPYLITNRST